MSEAETKHNAGEPAPTEAEVSRRGFLAKVSIALSSAGAAVLGVPIVGFVLGPLFRKRVEVWRPVGSEESFKVGHTVAVTFEDTSPLPWAGVTAQTAAWLRRVDQKTFIAFSINCTHLGCPVRWLPKADLFMCPCHGGVYYQDGKVAAGPPPKPLPRYPVRVRKGRVEVRTNPIPIA